MRDLHNLISQLTDMTHSEIRNYVSPGLTSWLVSGKTGKYFDKGKVRLFIASLDTREWITPHSHRFDFACLVLRGKVTNIVYTPDPQPMFNGRSTDYAVGKLRTLGGGLGAYKFVPGEEPTYYQERREEYVEGDCYSMLYQEIHSIQFSRDAMVLFFEGPEQTSETTVLEPWAYGKRVPTFDAKPWMFERVPDEDSL